MQLIESLFKQPRLRFNEHLNRDGNKKILFSGRFGIGKSTFLQNYFEEYEGGMTKYEAFFLTPVNYSVSSNEDIIEYIKYDIITEILRKKIHVESVDLRFIDTFPAIVKSNAGNIIKKVLHMVPEVGKAILPIAGEALNFFKVLESAVEGYEKWKEEHQKIADEANEQVQLTKYLESHEEKMGSIYEKEITTQLIEAVLDRHKSERGKETVLIIDDLDRLDPDHIFRILNVFAAHIDNKSDKIKFGFDKIILVCDIENLINVFSHRYGHATDFNGYINKFYSIDVFQFLNKAELAELCKKLLMRSDWQYFSDGMPNHVGSSIQEEILHDDHGFPDFLANLVMRDRLSLRSILRISSRFFFPNYYVIGEMYNRYSIDRFPIFPQVDILIQLFGSKQQFISAIKATDFTDFEPEPIRSIVTAYVFAVTAKSHNHEPKVHHALYLEIGENNYNATLSINRYTRELLDLYQGPPKRPEDEVEAVTRRILDLNLVRQVMLDCVSRFFKHT